MAAAEADIPGSKAGHFEPEKFVDLYETALVSLLKAKLAGRVIEAPKEEAGGTGRPNAQLIEVGGPDSGSCGDCEVCPRAKREPP
jgi:non-homologous end joining protein Ku